MFSLDEVKHIAELVKVDVSGSEKILSEMFGQTLDYIKILDELKIKNLSETYQVTGTENIFQTNTHPNNSLSQNEATQNGSDISNGLFVTKGVLNK